MNRRAHRSPTALRQSGAALIVGLLLMFVMTIMTTVAVNIGVFESRASGNELRASEAFQAGESGIHAAIEFIKENQIDMFSGDGQWVEEGRWVECAAAPGEEDVCAKVGPGLKSLIGPLYKYEYAGASHLPIPETMMRLPSGGYSVEALACFHNRTTDMCEPIVRADEADDMAVQLISVGASGDALGKSSISVTAAPFNIANPDLPAPVIVAGSFIGDGEYHVVANPNGGGLGVPVSVWSRDQLSERTETVTTCNLDEFLHTVHGGEAVSMEVVDNVTICSNCSCPEETNDQWQPITVDEQVYSGSVDDVADNDPGFPNDLFDYAFGVPTNDFETIKSGVAASVVNDCSGLTGESSGVIWVTGHCEVSATVGSPEKPVLLIAACGDLEATSAATIYGLVYVDDVDPACTGQSGRVTLVDGARTYGAMIVDKNIESGRGIGSVIYSYRILQNLGDGEKRWGALPGTWYDFVN